MLFYFDRFGEAKLLSYPPVSVERDSFICVSLFGVQVEGCLKCFGLNVKRGSEIGLLVDSSEWLIAVVRMK